MRASEVSPGGRVRLLPDGVDEVVGMVGRKRTRQSTDIFTFERQRANYVTTRQLRREACGPGLISGRGTLRIGLQPVYDDHAQAVGIPHGPPEERPLPTSRSVLTRPALRLKSGT